MKVFLSYSRRSEPTAHLLAYILQEHGLDCVLDRNIHAGRQFNDEIATMIADADLVLVLLDNASIRSQWVNQEIGYALGQGKRVWPVAVDDDLEPQGMLATFQSYSLLDWSRPRESIRSLLRALDVAATESHIEDHYRELGLVRIIQDQLERTRFINRHLESLIEEAPTTTILNQAIFSVFAASEDPHYWASEPGGQSADYRDLILQERLLMEKVVKLPGTTYKLLLSPVPSDYDTHLNRYRNLLKWLSANANEPTVDFRCIDYVGPNRLIVTGNFGIEARFHPFHGYSDNIVFYDSRRLHEAVADFERLFRSAAEQTPTKADTISMIHSRMTKLENERRRGTAKDRKLS